MVGEAHRGDAAAQAAFSTELIPHSTSVARSIALTIGCQTTKGFQMTICRSLITVSFLLLHCSTAVPAQDATKKSANLESNAIAESIPRQAILATWTHASERRSSSSPGTQPMPNPRPSSSIGRGRDVGGKRRRRRHFGGWRSRESSRTASIRWRSAVLSRARCSITG